MSKLIRQRPVRSIFSKTIFLRYCPFLMLLACFCCSQDTRPEPVILRLAHPMAPGNNVTLGYEKFKQLVEQKSRGGILIKLYADAFLGNDLVTMQAVQNGELEMASSSTPNLVDISDKFIAFDLPYSTRPENQEQLYRALDEGRLGRYLEEISAAVGLKPIMWSEYGYRDFATVERPVRLPGDLAGLRIRTTQSPVAIEIARILGAVPVPLIWADTYPALLRKVIDGEANTSSLLYSARHHEVLRHIVQTRHNYSMHALMMNLAFWKQQPENIRAIISAAAREALVYERSITRQLEQEARRRMQDQGVKIRALTPAELALWQKALLPVSDKFRVQAPELFGLLQETQQ